MAYVHYKHNKDKKKEEEENSLKDLVWEKVRLLDPNDPKGFGLDPCGALIHREKYANTNSTYGWEIDHTVPQSILEAAGVDDDLINNIDNLRPMQWQNNRRKDKNMPVYTSVVTAHNGENIDYEVNREINIYELSKVMELFNNTPISILPDSFRIDQFINTENPEKDITYFDPERPDNK